MGKPVKKSNELIKIRKRKIAIRRNILITILLLIILCTLCLKLPFFNIVSVSVTNNKNISSETIENLSGIIKGNNIFYINSKKVKANITSNPYILDVELSRKLPGTVVLNVKERDVTYYINDSDRYLIIDSQGIILEVRSSIDNMKLVKLDGLNLGSAEIGKVVNDAENRKLDIMKQLAVLFRTNISGIGLDRVDLTNLTDIRIYSSQLCFKIGDSFDMKTKLNKALNIAAKNEVKNKKGYIDVSFDGNPVFYIE